jgi:hypothetical protein
MTMPARRSSLIALLVLGTACASAAPEKREGGRVAATSSAGSAPLVAPVGVVQGVTDEAPLPALERDARGWQAGRHYRYRMLLGSNVSFAGKTGSDFELSGVLGLTCIAAAVDRVTLRVELESPRISSKLVGAQSQLERTLPELAAPFFVSFERGLISELRVAPGMTATAVGTYRTLAAALQLSPQPSAQRSWRTNERDTTGEYLAEYRRDHHGAIQKQKLRYSSLLLPPSDREKLPLPLLPEIASSRVELFASDDGRPLSVELYEQVAMHQLQAPMAAVNRVSLRWIGDEARAALAGDTEQLRQTRSLRPDEAYVATVNEAALDEARIDGLSFETITAELGVLAHGSDEKADAERNEQQVQRLVVALAAMFRQQPQTIQLALAKIDARAPGHGSLLDALAASGSEASQIALARLLQAQGANRDERHAAAFALSRVSKPSPAAISALGAQLDDEYVGTQALYGIGTYCRLLREAGDGAGSEQLGQLLLRRLAAAEGELALTRSLRAISNSGYAPALVAVKPLLADGREAVRADALEAIRLMRSPEVDGLIVARLQLEKLPKVQLVALDALKVRLPSAILARSLGSATRNEDPHVRHRAVTVAAAWLAQRPELRSSLQRVAQHDSEEKIRQLASAALRGRS